MNTQRDYLDYLNDIYDSINKGIAFINGMSYEDFSKDEKTQFALIRVIEIIGEAGKKYLLKLKTGHKKFPGGKLAG